MKLYRPVKWLRDKDWRFTQWYGANFKVWTKWMYWDIVKARPSHQGLDYAWPTSGSIIPCYSVEDWVVIFAWRDSWFWNMVKVSGLSWISYYCHLSKISVINWSTIKANTEIWLIGQTGNSTWIHLHFWWKPADKSLRKFSDWGDPTPYIVDRQTTVVTQLQPVVIQPIIVSEAQKAVNAWIWNWERPKDPATREEVATMIWRSMQK